MVDVIPPIADWFNNGFDKDTIILGFRLEAWVRVAKIVLYLAGFIAAVDFLSPKFIRKLHQGSVRRVGRAKRQVPEFFHKAKSLTKKDGLQQAKLRYLHDQKWKRYGYSASRVVSAAAATVAAIVALVLVILIIQTPEPSEIPGCKILGYQDFVDPGTYDSGPHYHRTPIYSEECETEFLPRFNFLGVVVDLSSISWVLLLGAATVVPFSVVAYSPFLAALLVAGMIGVFRFIFSLLVYLLSLPGSILLQDGEEQKRLKAFAFVIFIFFALIDVLGS